MAESGGYLRNAGNKAETLTILPVIRAFLARHQLPRLTVVTDAAMMSADNLAALEDAGLDFIVADRIRKVPYEIDDYIDRHGNHFADGQTFEVTRTMGTGTHARRRRVIYQYPACPRTPGFAEHQQADRQSREDDRR